MKRILHMILKIFKGNLHLKIMAILFAFILWSYVMAGTNPDRPKTVNNVGVRMMYTEELKAKGLVIDQELSELVENVRIEVEAGIDSHKYISANTLNATVDLSEINQTGEVELKIIPTSAVSGVTIKSVSPSTIKLSVDKLVTREIPIECVLEGTAPEGYYVGTPVLSSNFVEVSGPEQRLNKIAKAVCSVPVNELTADVRASYLLTMLDESGNQLSTASFVGALPSVVVEIPVLPTKNVPINQSSITVTNIKQGYEVTGVTVQPNNIQIAGSAALLEQIDEVQLQTLNADGADRSVLLAGHLQAIEGIKFLTTETINIYVQITELQTQRTFTGVSIDTLNLESGYRASVRPHMRTDVTISGGESVVNELDKADIHAYIDLSNLQQGTYVLPVMVADIPGIDATDVTCSLLEVTVVIS